MSDNTDRLEHEHEVVSRLLATPLADALDAIDALIVAHDEVEAE